MATIEIEVNPDAAAAYTSAPAETQKKVQVLLNAWLPALTTTSTRSLRAVMDQMSGEAEARGLTDEILESILRDQEWPLCLRYECSGECRAAPSLDSPSSP